jgi:hypothetical protein
MVDCTSTTFSDAVAPSSVVVTDDAAISGTSTFTTVSKIIVPSQALVCGNDLALLILSKPFALPAYVTPVISPPMTDRSTYSTSITAIGYGVDTPTDTTGTTAGTRRIRQNIDLLCISNDTSLADCLANGPPAAQIIGNNEFESLGFTCDGDSGSGAFEQRNFNAGRAVSFGVLSRGGVSADGGTCLSSIYTRFDAWGSLLSSAAVEAAQMGGYAPPAWAGASTLSDGGSCLGQSASCNANGDCCANNCVSHDNGATFVCASCDANNPCDTGLACQQGTCVPADSFDAGASSTVSGAKSGKGGCAVANRPGEERGRGTSSCAVALAALLAGVSVARRRRSPART